MNHPRFIHSTLRFKDKDMDMHLYVEDKNVVEDYIQSHPDRIVLSVAEDAPYKSHTNAYVRISYIDPVTKKVVHTEAHTRDLARGDICDVVSNCEHLNGVVSDITRNKHRGGKKYRNRKTKKSVTKRKKSAKSRKHRK